jgi:hypothetical protein
MNHIGDFYSIVCYYRCSPCNWNFFYILLYIVLTQYCGRGIFTKVQQFFFSPTTHTMQSIADGHIT